MRFYNINMKGKFHMPRSGIVPSDVGADQEGRLHYNETDETVHYADSTSWVVIYSENNITQLASDLNDSGAALNADNLLLGTVPTGRMTGTYTIDIIGTARYA